MQDFAEDEDVAAIYFDLTIDGVIKSEFCSVLTIDLAKYIADKVLGVAEEIAAEPPVQQAAPAADSGSSGGGTMSQAEMDAMFANAGGAGAQASGGGTMSQAEMDAMFANAGGAAQMPGMQPMQGMPQMQGMQPGMPQMQGMPQMPYGYPPQYGYPPPYGYPQGGYGGYPQPMNVQNAQLNQFDAPNMQLTGEQKTNLQLLMGVPLEISVEIGTAKRKVKEILEFTQGTIIELERQAGAPVDIIVNGNLIAKGDIVVIDDNFAVRITEIIKSKLMDSINKE